MSKGGGRGEFGVFSRYTRANESPLTPWSKLFFQLLSTYGSEQVSFFA